MPEADGPLAAGPCGDEGAVFGRAVAFLLSQTGAATSRRFKEALGELSLDPRQFVVMRAIASAPNPSQQSLADSLSIPPSSMVSLVDQLENRGLVARNLDVTDRRVHLLVLTEEGETLLVRAMQIAMGIESTVCDRFEAGERATLIGLLDRVARNLELREGIHPELANEVAVAEGGRGLDDRSAPEGG